MVGVLKADFVVGIEILDFFITIFFCGEGFLKGFFEDFIGVLLGGVASQKCRIGVHWKFLLPRSTLYKCCMFPISKNQKRLQCL